MRLAIPARRLYTSLLLGLLIVIASACEAGGPGGVTQGEYEQIDSLFREFYEHLGGMELLGPGISPAFEAGGLTYQYTSGCLMVYDPLGPASQRFRLAPLGLDLGIAEPPIPPPQQPGLRYIDGHILYEAFVPFYERLGGARFIGRPITEVHYSPETRRYEQHFENIGLYRLEDEAQGVVHAMNYGAWKCSASCRQVPAGNALVFMPPRIGELFTEAVSRLGQDFTGYALTDPYPVESARTEQVFENLVLVADPANPGQVVLRAITERLGILPDPFSGPLGDARFSFYPLQGELGHNIPQEFIDFMALHGGLSVSGPPITEMTRLSDSVFRQCFANLCLEEHYGSSGAVWIRPAPLGYSYRTLGVPWAVQATAVSAAEPTATLPPQVDVPEATPPPAMQAPTPLPESLPAPVPEVQPTQVVAPPADGFSDSQSFRAITIQVWETYPLVASNASQEIGVGVFENNLPMRSVEPDLEVALPEGGIKTYYMYPTGEDGMTRMQIDPVTAPNGTVIPYQVCILNLSGERFCVKDSFLIWQNP